MWVLGWYYVGTRLAPGRYLVGTRLVLGWYLVGAWLPTGGGISFGFTSLHSLQQSDASWLNLLGFGAHGGAHRCFVVKFARIWGTRRGTVLLRG